MIMKDLSRRNFIRTTTLLAGGIPFLPASGPSSENSSGRASNAKTEKLTILCVGAHPGDPEFGCGGTMARYADAGHNLIFLYLTRGEAWAGDPSLSYSQAAAIRTKEAETSCRILNAKPLFAGQTDGDTVLNKKSITDFTNLIASQIPDVVFTQWPLDSHPDHQAAGCLTLNAWLKSDKSFDLYFYEVDTGSETMAFVPTDYVDITNVLNRKKEAMFAHKSQGPQEIYEKDFVKMQGFRGLEAGVKVAEAFIHFNSKADQNSVIGL